MLLIAHQVTPQELQKGLVQAGFDVAGADAAQAAGSSSSVPPGWIGMGPTVHGPISGLRRMFLERRGFAGWVGPWVQKIPAGMHGKDAAGVQGQLRGLLGGLATKWDTDASYLGWATKRA